MPTAGWYTVQGGWYKNTVMIISELHQMPHEPTMYTMYQSAAVWIMSVCFGDLNQA